MNKPPKILVADDDETALDVLREALTLAGYQVVTARTGDETLRVARSERPDLILLDILMPGQNGFEVCRLLKGDPNAGYLPILLVTALADTEDRIRGFSRGADGYLQKPFDITEVEARIRNHLQVKEQHDLLQETTNRLRDLAVTDSLTGLYNRRHLLERLAYEFLRARRYGTQLAVSLIDIDEFKNVNDSFGHLVGDFVLKEASDLFKAAIRETDIIARYGGEEFVIVMPAIDAQGAPLRSTNAPDWILEAGERVRAKLEAHSFKNGEVEVRITASVGIAAFPFHPAEEAIDLLQLADEALYVAKRAGRNRVVLWSRPGK
ncbi:MAG: diguanylate cyclase [Deltaproteobacteria bacterium]|nr:diguanylate cyclase [Deltaproteobacteria bacterium]